MELLINLYAQTPAVVVLLFILLFLCFIIPKWCVQYLSRKLQLFIPVSVDVSKVGIFWGEDIQLRFFGGDTLYIQHARITSSLFDSSAKCLITIIVTQVQYTTTLYATSTLLVTLQSHKRKTVTRDKKSSERGWMVTVSQFIGVSIYDVSFKTEVLPNTRTFVVIHIAEISLRFALDALHLKVNVNAHGLFARLNSYSEKENDWLNCRPLASLNCHVMLDVVLDRYKSRPINLLYIKVLGTKICILDELASDLSIAASSYTLIGPPNLVRSSPPTHQVGLFSGSNLASPSDDNNSPVIPDTEEQSDKVDVLATLPREASFELDELQCEILRLSPTKNIRVSWDSFLISATCTQLEENATGLSARMSIQNFSTKSEVQTYASLNKVEVTCLSDYNCVVLSCNVDNPFFSYIHDEFLFWHQLLHAGRTLCKLASRTHQMNKLYHSYQQPSAQRRAAAAATQKKVVRPWSQKLLQGRKFTVKLEVNCTCRGKEVDPNSRLAIQIAHSEGQPGLEIGLKSWTLNLETDRLFLRSDCGISTGDFHSEINTMYCKCVEASTQIFEYHDTGHYWNTVLYLGNGFVWGHKRRLGCLLSYVQVEWSPQLARVIDLSLPLFLPLTHSATHPSPSVSPAEPTSTSSSFNTKLGQLCDVLADVDLDIKLDHINLFNLHEKNVFLMQRVDCVQLLNKASAQGSFSVKSALLVYETLPFNLEESYPIKPCHQIESSDHMLTLQELILKYDHQDRQALVLCNDRVSLVWTPAMHLCLKGAIDSIHKNLIIPVRKFTRNYFGTIKFSPVKSPTSLCQPAPEPDSTQSADSPSTPSTQSNPAAAAPSIRANLEFTDCVEILFQLSEDHVICLYLDRVYGSVTDRVKWNVTQLVASFDKSDILLMDDLVIRSNHYTNEYRTDKEKLKLKTATNRTWEVLSTGCFITFPYRYNFHECYSELISVRKFLRTLHASKSDPYGADKPLPADVFIFIKKVVLEIKDDPFECLLGVIFPIQLDESVQHAKRVETMAVQLKANPNINEQTRQAYFAKLEQERPAQYIGRLKRFHHRYTVSDSLFTWIMENLRLTTLADSEFRGRENVIRQLVDIDKDSPLPSDMTFTTLWCRMINLNIDRWTWKLRDYSKPFWDMTDLLLWGRLCGAENSPAERATREVFVTPGEPWPSYRVIRSMPVLKFYHDFTADLKDFSLCYGPNWEPCMAWLNLSMEQINRPSRDPSPPLPWWDKMRLKFHGRLCFMAETMQWFYPTSLDPYNSTEFFDWQWSKVIVNWTNMKFRLEGNLDVYCRTASKYDGDCRLLHLPDLDLLIQLEWISLGDPNDHHRVMQCAADKVPHLPDGEQYDSYKVFRSKSLNVSFIFIVTKNPNFPDIPKCQFYTNILKFFDKFKMCLSKTSRPIRRGKLFNCVKPKKSIFGRIFKRIFLKFQLPCLDLSYWVSFAKKNGVRLTSGPLSLEADFSLEIQPYNDELRRRPRADWFIERMRAELLDGHIWLRQTNSESDSHSMTGGGTMPRAHSTVNMGLYTQCDIPEFMIIPVIRYERIRPSPTSPNQPVCRVAPGLTSTNAQTTSSTAPGTIGQQNSSSATASTHDGGVPSQEVNDSIPGTSGPDVKKKSSCSVRSYGENETNAGNSENRVITHEELTPIHRVETRDLKVRWTEINRNLVYSMIDIHRHAQSLRKNLSAQALKALQVQETHSINPVWSQVSQSGNAPSIIANPGSHTMPGVSHGERLLTQGGHSTRTEELSEESLSLNGDSQEWLPGWRHRSTSDSTRNSASPALVHQTNAAAQDDQQNGAEQGQEGQGQGGFKKMLNNIPMLTQLLEEVDTAKFYAYCEQEPKQVNVMDHLQGVALCTTTEVLSRRWHVELINSQVLMKTAELSGYVIVSAAKTRLDSLEHRPVWRDSQLLTKSTLVGKLECMQYYATVGQVKSHQPDQWLNSSDVEDHVGTEDLLTGKPEIVGCGKAVGGVVSGCVGQPVKSIQLQRMISRCTCHVFYVSYDQADPNTIPTYIIPPLPLEEDEVLSTAEGANTFTLVHRTLNICTNSLQYHMIVDLVNDLLLYVEPQRKARIELNRMKLWLKNEEKLKYAILNDQEELRNLVHNQKKLERELWELSKEKPVTGSWEVNHLKQKQVEHQILLIKNQIVERNAALSQFISFHQQKKVQYQRQIARSQIQQQNNQRNTTGELCDGDNTSVGGTEQESHLPSEVIRKNEVCFEHARWRMTETDGQIGLADVELRGFIYEKENRADDSGAHHLELGWMKVENLTPNCIYKDVLMPNTANELYTENNPVLRIVCVEGPRVGGIQVKEVLEINVAPLVLQVSKQFFRTMMPYFFPDKVDEALINAHTESLTVPNMEQNDVHSEPNLTPTQRRRNPFRFGGKGKRSSKKTNSLFNEAVNEVEEVSSLSPHLTTSNSNPAPLPPQIPKSGSFLTDSETPSGAPLIRSSSMLGAEAGDLGAASVPWDSSGTTNLTIEEALQIPVAVVFSASETQESLIDQSGQVIVRSNLPSTGSNTQKQQNQRIAIDKDSVTQDPVERMRERARKNNVFHYIKIPEFPLRLSYKGEKQKNLSDVVDFALTIPTIEYRSVTLTWLDLLLYVKSEIRTKLIKEVIKKKLTLRKGLLRRPSRNNSKLNEEDKEKKTMEMILGRHANPKENTDKKSGLFKRN